MLADTDNNKVELKNAKYTVFDGVKVGINVEINGVIRNVPISENNADYKFIKSRVDAGTLTIADAD